MNRTNRDRGWRGRVLLVITSVVGVAAVIVLAEVCARLLFPENVPATERVAFFRYDPLLGWSHIPDHRSQLKQRDFRIDVSINSLGLRDDEYPQRADDAKRMLVLGDSFAWGFGVEHENRFSEILEQMHTGWEIINAGVNGYGTDQQLLYLQDRGLALEPDMVLLLFHENDFGNNLASEQYWYNKPRFVATDSALVLQNVPVPPATLDQQIRRVVLGRTYLGQSMHRAWRAFAAAQGAPADAESPADVDRRVDAEASITTRLLREMNDECLRRGARMVLVSVPMPEELRKTLIEVATAEGIDYLELDSAFAAVDPPSAVTFAHDEHWNDRGHDTAARAIDRFLVRLGVFKSERLTG